MRSIAVVLSVFFIAAFSATGSGGCAAVDKPAMVTVPAEVLKACKLPAKPKPPKIAAHGPSTGCTLPFVLCFDEYNAMLLLAHLIELNEWIDKVAAKCGTEKKDTTLPPVAPTATSSPKAPPERAEATR